MSLTDQQALDGVRKWIERPDATRCFDQFAGQCVYRRPDGNRCAIGGLLFGLIEEDSGVWEDESGVDTLIDLYPDAEFVLQGVDLGLLSAMQQAHDRQYGAADGGWQQGALKALEEIAQQYELVWQ